MGTNSEASARAWAAWIWVVLEGELAGLREGQGLGGEGGEGEKGEEPD